MAYWPFEKPNTNTERAKIETLDKAYFVTKVYCYGIAVSGVTTTLRVYLPSGELCLSTSAQPNKTSTVAFNNILPKGTTFSYSQKGHGGAKWGAYCSDVIWEEIPELASGGG